jgi:hypothetical protein
LCGDIKNKKIENIHELIKGFPQKLKPFEAK